MYKIQLIPTEKLDSILPLLQKLNPKIERKVLEDRLPKMIASGYECVGVYDQDKLVGISGMWFLTKYYIGKHVEPDNVYILPEYQGKGIGGLLMDWIFKYAKSKDCEASELNCYIDNAEGQKFWKNLGYTLLGYRYTKKL